MAVTAKWGLEPSGLYLIHEYTVTATITSVVLGPIPQTFRHLHVRFWDVTSSQAATDGLVLRFNNDSTASQYATRGGTADAFSNALTGIAGVPGATQVTADPRSGAGGTIDIQNYGPGSKESAIVGSSTGRTSSTGTVATDVQALNWLGLYGVAAAPTNGITSMQFTMTTSGQFTAGSFAVYGIGEI